MKAPRGLPSLAPRTMDPAYMQQQMMQKAMMGQGQGQPRVGMAEGEEVYGPSLPKKEKEKEKEKKKEEEEKMPNPDRLRDPFWRWDIRLPAKEKPGTRVDPTEGIGFDSFGNIDVDMSDPRFKWGKYDPEQDYFPWEFEVGKDSIGAQWKKRFNQGGRIGFGLGGIDKGRRAFMKWLAGITGAGIAAGTGLLKFGKAAKVVPKVTESFTHVPIKDIPGMPAWFKPLVAKVINQGTDVTKKYAVKDLEVVHHTKLPTSGTDVLVTQQLDTGDVLVDIGIGKHGWPAGRYGQPARLEYKAAEDIMTGPKDEPFKSGRKRDPFLEIKTKVHEDLVGSGLKGDPKNLHLKPGKKKEEFFVDEAEFTGGHPENVKFEETVGFKYGDHGSDFGEVERFATGKKNIDKKIVGKQRDADNMAEERAIQQAEDVDDFAKGGVAYLLGE